MTKIIINRETTDLWFDPWINHKSLVDLLGWDRIYLTNTANRKVNIIIRDNQFQPQVLSKN